MSVIELSWTAKKKLIFTKFESLGNIVKAGKVRFKIKPTRLIKKEHLLLNIGTSLATIVVNCSLEEVFGHRESN